MREVARHLAPPVVAVVGAMDGIGRTTVATLLAWAIGDLERSAPALVLDLGTPGLDGGVGRGRREEAPARCAAIVVDMPSDATGRALDTLRSADAVVVVASPTPDGITSAVRAIRRLARVAPHARAWVVVNRATPSAARATFAAIEDCCAALDGCAPVELRFLCSVARDAALARACHTQIHAHAEPGIDSWNLAAARRAAGALTHEVSP